LQTSHERLAIERGWLSMHESGTYVRFTQAGAELFAYRSPGTAVVDAHRFAKEAMHSDAMQFQ
jgi:hypothetical protein